MRISWAVKAGTAGEVTLGSHESGDRVVDIVLGEKKSRARSEAGRQ